ncbi:MAG: hypothetical protein R3B95_11590 [Nitrospirales bacterium]|nr:hypothetical protein [Nitrospirales bacterium]
MPVYTVWPTANDVGPVAGDGLSFSEIAFASLLKTLIGQNFIVEGFLLPSSDADLTLTIPSGKAVIDGHYVNFPSSTNVVCTANISNYIFLRLIKDVGGLVDDAEIIAQSSPSPPADSVGLGIAVADASSITSTTDTRYLAGVVNHDHSGTSNGKGGTIAGNAVSAYDATHSGSVSNSTSVTDASLSLTARGTPKVLLQASCVVAALGGSIIDSVKMIIRRDGAQIGNPVTLQPNGISVDETTGQPGRSLSVIDAPAAGSHTYDVAITRAAGGTAATFEVVDVHLTVFTVV